MLAFKSSNLDRVPGGGLAYCLALTFLSATLAAQQTAEVNREFARGDFIHGVRIYLTEDSVTVDATAEQLDEFYDAFFIRPGTTFNPLVADLAINRIRAQEGIGDAYYRLYEAPTGNGSINPPIDLLIYVELEGEGGGAREDEGLLTGHGVSSLPVLYESDRAQLKVLVNGGAGIYDDFDPFFGQTAAFAEQNPVADDPAGEGSRFWLETYLEPGVTGITQLGGSNLYAYGEFSVLGSARNASDVYSAGATAYLAVERAYGGLLAAGLGPGGDVTVNASYGRNFFQLNDGFLFSKISGSANAGTRGSVYSSTRKVFEKAGALAVTWDKFSLSGHFVEPQELFRDRQTNTGYAIGTFNFNDNESVDAGFSYVTAAGGRSRYVLPEGGSIPKAGMYILNPKLWLTDIGGTGLFFKSEFAYQRHHGEDMRAYAWYTGLGHVAKSLKTTPSVYYRFAYMSGDDPATAAYERFDPLLTGTLGNWVQGLNYRKILGNGNLVTHRVEVTSWLTERTALSLDYFYLRADRLNNLGGLPPIAQLSDRAYGHEATLTLKGLIRRNVTLLGIVSYAIPGKGLTESFDEPIPDWLTAQLAFFLNY